MTFQKANALAIKRSKEHKDQRYYVILIDNDSKDPYTQDYAVCPESYLDTDEFIAFNGLVVDEYFNGELVW